ncbi:hypothetical protein TD95_003869 [Thielaviopsis punctulata]|uniref:BRCT domain-containing protein n=1 Tax=Thielaviopsis punctulata TaxID=72032 RepID=A0A0F4ZID7_9PEZI|nr:hypothetical protein TD95_003869 [Thielaviopsis punctulata]
MDSNPLAGVVICFTSIQAFQRESLATIATNLGATHTYDLTKQTTHLIVGSHESPKYRHVARSRPDIKAMDALWILAVRDAWRADEFDFDRLQKMYELKALETGGVDVDVEAETIAAEPGKRPALKICLTGIDDIQQRAHIRHLIESGGATYTGELNRSVTHLLVSRPSGSKYEAARQWNIPTVSLAWLTQSLQRGMILGEQYFNPLLPADQQGSAFDPIVPEKRKHAGPQGSVGGGDAPDSKLRKLRKTASLKLGSHQAAVWTSILGASSAASKPPETADSSFAEPNDDNNDDDNGDDNDTNTLGPKAAHSSNTKSPSRDVQPQDLQPKNLSSKEALTTSAAAIFSGCAFYIYGFPTKKMRVARQAVASRGALIGASIRETRSLPCTGPKFALVPQDAAWDSLQHVHDSDLTVVTEFFVEKCLFNKKLVDPQEHVLGRPFRVFPVEKMAGLRVHTSGFSGIDLLHVQRSLGQLGATAEENFGASCELLVLQSLARARKDKLQSALKMRTPIVSAEWLWACIQRGERVDYREFYFSELQNLTGRRSIGETTVRERGKLADSGKALAKGKAVDAEKVFEVSEKALSRAAETNKASGQGENAVNKGVAKASFLKAVMEDQEEDDDDENKEDANKENEQPKKDERSEEEKRREGAKRSEETKQIQRRALSDQLSTILHTHITHPGPSPAPAPISTDPTSADDAPSVDADSPMKKRARRTFGRNMSSASAYSERTAGESERGGEQQAEEEEGKKKKEKKAAPTPTQVEYRDPEAAKVRAVLLSRLESK